jgi:hypothetical protein
VEVLNLFGRQGERMHVRTKPRARQEPASSTTTATGRQE